MSNNTSRKFSANEKEIEELLQENGSWKQALAEIAEEIRFLEHFLEADIFQDNVPNLFERLQEYYTELEDFKTRTQDLGLEVHNHRHDVQGMMECEDISCEVFYHDEHLKLGERVRLLKAKFTSFRLNLFSFTGSLLKMKE